MSRANRVEGKQALIGLILAAAGRGTRFGAEVPKQFLSSRGKRVYQLALDAFLPFVGEAVILVPTGWLEKVQAEMARLVDNGQVVLAAGGCKRQDSVYIGLQLFSSQVEIVLVHDAARPFVSSQVITRVIQAAREGGASVPILPIGDTVKQVTAGTVMRTLEREQVALAQTPQGFQIGLLRKAFCKAREDKFLGTDESSLVERMGVCVKTVMGDSKNVKITFEGDL